MFSCSLSPWERVRVRGSSGQQKSPSPLPSPGGRGRKSQAMRQKNIGGLLDNSRVPTIDVDGDAGGPGDGGGHGRRPRGPATQVGDVDDTATANFAHFRDDCAYEAHSAPDL